MFIVFHFQTLKQSSTELLFGGHETTASAATSLITYLGLYPHVLQKVREELKSKVGVLWGSCYFQKSRCSLADFPRSKVLPLLIIVKCGSQGWWVNQWGKNSLCEYKGGEGES